MEHALRWGIIGILVCICIALISINNKINQLDMRNTEIAILDEVKNQSFTGVISAEKAEDFTSTSMDFPYMSAIMCFAILTVTFVTWHLSRLYHEIQWSKKILRKSYGYRREPIVDFRPKQVLHEDQDAIFEQPHPDGHITDSWLPPREQKLYESWGRRNS